MGIAAVAAVAGAALAAGGCGGGSGTPRVAALGTTAPTTTTGDTRPRGASKGSTARAFSACMRRNGIRNFPDPGPGGGLTISPASGIDRESRQFQGAEETCMKLLPNGGRPTPQEIARAQAQSLAFSRCMRNHGVPRFPDPQFGAGGKIHITIGRGSGIDPSAPAFQAAQQACGAILGKGLPAKAGTGR
jgi:hypothetical protein